MSGIIAELKKCPGCKSLQPMNYFETNDHGWSIGKCLICMSEEDLKDIIQDYKPPEGFKVCSVCEEEKTVSEFWACSVNRDGLHSQCKECIKDAHRIKYAEDPEFAERAKVHARGWRESNPERDKENRRRWQQNNIEKFKEMKSKHAHNRRVKMNGSEIHTDISIVLLYESDEGICTLCFCECSKEDATIDHDIPISRGGGHTWDNVQLAHMLCNQQKGNKTTEEFFSS